MPIGIFALVVVQAVLKLDHTPRTPRIDWNGAAALVIGLVPLLLVAEQGRSWGWASPGSFACYVVGAFGVALFVWVEGRMGDDALIPLRLFRGSVFALGSAQSAIIGMGMFGGLAALPLYLQIVKGASPTKSGLLLLPLVFGIMTFSLVAGQVTARTGRYKIFPILGSALLVAALLLMTQIGADTALWHTDLLMFAFGAGLGMNMQTIILAMQNSVDAKDMGVATASATFFRQIGATLGTAVFLSILFSSAGSKIESAYQQARGTSDFQAAAQAHPNQLASVSGGADLNNTDFLKGLDSVLAHPFRVGFSDAMDLVFLVGGLVLVIAFVLSLLMKEVPLRTVSGQQARAADATNAASLAPTAVGKADTSGAAVGRHEADGMHERGRHEADGVHDSGRHEASDEQDAATGRSVGSTSTPGR